MARQGPWNRVVLHGMIVRHFNLNEVKTLCFKLGVSADVLPDGGIEDKVRELIEYLDRRGRIGELVELCQQERPEFRWERVTGSATTSYNTGMLDSRLANERIEPSVGIITARPEEYDAARVMIDDGMYRFTRTQQADEPYYLGKIPGAGGRCHFVVLSRVRCIGNNVAADWAASLVHDFPTVCVIIMVGIAGGVPCPADPERHVRLGDVVVSSREGVVQYDFVNQEVNQIIPRQSLGRPSARLLYEARRLEASRTNGESWYGKLVVRVTNLLGITRPTDDQDLLYRFIRTQEGYVIEEEIKHPKDKKRIIGMPRVFIGPIASAHTFQKDPFMRDALSREFGVRAVEMEDSGRADAKSIRGVDYLVVRGICDYCVPCRNNVWHEYAAATAAAYTRALLEFIPGQVSYTRALFSSIPDPDRATQDQELLRAEVEIGFHLERVDEYSSRLESYKRLHDEFQELNRLYDIVSPDPKLLSQHVPQMQEIIGDQLELVSRIQVFSGVLWVRQLKQARTKLGLTTKRSDGRLFEDDAIRLLGRVLDDAPKAINLCLVSEAKRFSSPLGRLVDMMGTLQDKFASRDYSLEVAGQLVSYVDTLSSLSKRLNELATEHNHWQDIDDRILKRVGINPDHLPMRISSEWDDLRRITEDICVGNSEEWAVSLYGTMIDLGHELAKGDPDQNAVQGFFGEYRSMAIDRFSQVDTRLLTLCKGELLEVRQDLSGISRSLQLIRME